MVAIFLVYNDAAGSEGLIELFPEEDCSTFFLPDNPSTARIDLSPHVDKEHSYLCLELHKRFALLRTFNSSHGPCSIAGSDQTNFELPVSKTSHFISIILRPGDQFLAPSGRWTVRWDDDGKITESMRAPQLALLTDTTETSGAHSEPLQETLDEHLGSPSRLSDATCSPTPSPVKGKEHPGSCASTGDQHLPSSEESAATVTSQAKAEPAKASSDQRDLVEPAGSAGEVDLADESNCMSSIAHHMAESESVLGAEEVAVDLSDVSALDGVENIPAALENSLSAADMSQTPGNPHEAIEDPREPGEMTTPSTPDEPRGSKRKFDEIEGADSDRGATDTESNLSIDAGPVETIVVNRKPKRSYSSKDRSYIAKSPSTQPRGRQSSTPNTTPRSSTPSDQPPAKRRSDRQQGTPFTAGQGRSTPVVIFSSATTIDQEKTTMRTFRKLGGRVTEAILEATILCVPEGALKKTSKLVMAVALGLDIVTEQCITETHRLGKFPAIQSYLPSDRPSEQEWGISLEDAITRGKCGLTQLLAGVRVFFTKKLRTGLGKLERDFSQIATRLGAESVERRLPGLKGGVKPEASAVLIIGAQDDPQGALVARLGYTLFNKDILVMGALRGRLERDSEEFVMDVPIKEEEET